MWETLAESIRCYTLSFDGTRMKLYVDGRLNNDAEVIARCGEPRILYRIFIFRSHILAIGVCAPWNHRLLNIVRVPLSYVGDPTYSNLGEKTTILIIYHAYGAKSKKKYT